jgi:hypothetical protein
MNRLTKQRAPFTQVPNSLLCDPDISFKAKGLYALMYSKPDGWTFYEGALAKESRDGKEAVSSGLDELVKAGWLRRSGGREQGTNRFCAYDYELLVSRDGEAVAEKPSRESRDGKPATNNTQGSNKEEDTPQPPKGAGKVEGFDEFWSAYPRKVGKPKALSAWKTKKPDLVTVLASLRRWKASDQWTKDDGRYIPHPTTWLNREGWNDVIPGEKAAPSADEMKAAADRIEAARQANAERDRQMVEARRRQLGLSA